MRKYFLRVFKYASEGAAILVNFNSFTTEVPTIRNQSIVSQNKSMDWFLYDLRHERVKFYEKFFLFSVAGLLLTLSLFLLFFVKDEIEKMKAQHTTEIEKLNKRLKWYSENQQLIDQDAVELTNKRQEIKELRELVERLEEQNRKLRREELQSKNERQNENKKLSDLQRQVYSET